MKHLQSIFISVLTLVLFSGILLSQISGHQDWQKLPRGCASCHVGHGKSGTAMLPAAEEEFCYQCHGDFNEFERAVRNEQLLANVKMKNMRKIFRKPHRHPVELKTPRYKDTADYGSRKNSIYTFTRAECLDCHRGHGVTRFEYTPGTSPKQSPKNDREFEYQLCYQCHSRIVQSSLATKDIRGWFDTTNPSYHPIEAAGKNSNVPSLKSPYSVAGMINCTDCHNSDDPDGPQGPHGSIYEYILELNYNLNDNTPENKRQYSLCYKCHDRDSILNNESFPYHRQHIVESRTSCFTCHHSHGSQRNTHLIKFNENTDPFVIQPSSSGQLEFFDRGRFNGECFLSCHNVDHNPRSYFRR